jgi:hypothetical protein
MPRRGEATTKLQKAGRAFLLRLIARHRLRGAARVLRALADEINALAIEARHQRGMCSKQTP